MMITGRCRADVDSGLVGVRWMRGCVFFVPSPGSASMGRAAALSSPSRPSGGWKKIPFSREGAGLYIGQGLGYAATQESGAACLLAEYLPIAVLLDDQVG